MSANGRIRGSVQSNGTAMVLSKGIKWYKVLPTVASEAECVKDR